jgi:hypothetical protein
MIIVKIGNAEKEGRDATPSWLNEQIQSRRAHGVPICVRVVIKTGPIDMLLQTPGCGSGGGGGRTPSPEERKIFARWAELGLDNDPFDVGNLIRFLRDLSSL